MVLGSASYGAHAADERRDFIQKMSALQRPTVFIGCSEDGLKDPDFSRLAAWLQTMNDLSQRRYWLVPQAKLISPDPGARLYSVPFGDLYSDLPAFVAGLDQNDLEASLAVLPGGFHLGALTLLQLRLIEQRGPRLYMLAPLREAVNEEIKDGLL